MFAVRSVSRAARSVSPCPSGLSLRLVRALTSSFLSPSPSLSLPLRPPTNPFPPFACRTPPFASLSPSPSAPCPPARRPARPLRRRRSRPARRARRPSLSASASSRSSPSSARSPRPTSRLRRRRSFVPPFSPSPSLHLPLLTSPPPHTPALVLLFLRPPRAGLTRRPKGVPLPPGPAREGARPEEVEPAPEPVPCPTHTFPFPPRHVADCGSVM